MKDQIKTLKNNEFGIEINAKANCKASDGILLYGAYKVMYPDFGIPSSATLIPKHVALVVTRTGNYSSCKPFYDVVAFEDDIKDYGKYCTGQFNLNVLNHIPFDSVGDYYIVCSLGIHLSNIIKVTVS